MTVNEIKLQGRVYRCIVRSFSDGKKITLFGLQFWNAKKEGKNEYCFINVKYFGDKPIPDKKDVVVAGYLKVEEWKDKKTGETKSSFFINANNIELKGQESELAYSKNSDKIPW